MREMVHWLCVLPIRAWFNTAFVSVGQNSFWTAFSSPLCLVFISFCSISFLHRYFFLTLTLLSVFVSTSVSPLPDLSSVSFSIIFCSFYSTTAYHSLSLYASLFLFLFIAATYISILLSFTLLPVSFNPPPPLKICPSFSINNPTLSFLSSPPSSLMQSRRKDGRRTEKRSDGKTRGHKINWRFHTTGCEGRETERWMSVVSVVMAIEIG